MEQQYRVSRYNSFVPLEGEVGTLAYNARCSSLVVIAPDLQNRLEQLAGTQAIVDSDDELAKLLPFGLVVPAGFDELSGIRARARKLRSGRNNLVLTIAPTLSCNFRCGYCFQDHPSVFMEEEVVTGLIAFVEAQANELEGLSITWFGGEPLLATPIIHRLSRALRDLSEQHGFELEPASIITNGWHLTDRNCRLLQDCGIGFIQVTLDGVGRAHDQRRPLANGAPTFERIVEGIKTALARLPDARIAVRVNLEQTNANAVDEVYEHFRACGIADLVEVDAALTQPFTARSRVEAPLTEQRVNEIVSRHRARRAGDRRQHADLPEQRCLGYCQAQFRNAFVVSPTGALFKCWRDLGLDEACAVGHLVTRELAVVDGQRAVREDFETWDFTQDDECANCRVAPVCGGGCMVEGMRRNEDYSRPRKVCSPYRDRNHLAEALMLAYESRSARLEWTSLPASGLGGLGLRTDRQRHGPRAPGATDPGHEIPGVRVICRGNASIATPVAPSGRVQGNQEPESITICTCGALGRGCSSKCKLA